MICEEFSASATRIKSYEWHQKQAVSSLLEEGLLSSANADFGKWADDFSYFIATHAGLIADSFMSGIADMKLSAVFSMLTKQTVSYSDNFELLLDDLLSYKKNDFRVLILCENEVMAKNLLSMTQEKGLSLPVIPSEGVWHDAVPVAITYGVNLSGFELATARFAVLSTYPAGSTYSSARLAKNKKRGKISQFMEWLE